MVLIQLYLDKSTYQMTLNIAWIHDITTTCYKPAAQVLCD